MIRLVLCYGPIEMLFVFSYQSMQVPRVQFMGQICFISYNNIVILIIF